MKGLRRQLRHAGDQLKHATTLHQEAHRTRLAASTRHFTEWTLKEVVPTTPDAVDRESLLERIPRASSREEMEPVLDALLQQVAEAKDQIGRHLQDDDTSEISLDTLRERGLVVTEDDQDLYEQIMDEVREALPRPHSGIYTPYLPSVRAFVSPEFTEIDMRRLDEAIREEREHAARKRGLEAEVVRLRSEIDLIGSPVGVTPAIAILAWYSAVGILLPVLVMAANPGKLRDWKVWVLAALFAFGLAGVVTSVEVV